MKCRILLCFILAVGGTSAAQDGHVARSTQHALIDAALSGFVIEPGLPTRVFFLGFAGYGEERVFAEEIKFAAQRVGERYGSSARSLLLINDRRDLTSHPLATHDNLRYALRQMGRLMNPASDILFLVLSSHGARNAMIEVSNTGMEPLGLSPQTVDLLTREAGIRLRVVVVSACFSGAFVEPLADAETVVLTAASRNRTSFGCSDQRHLTYFGEAFFADALPAAPSLRGAFEATRREIRDRERAERIKPSQPQSHFGPVVEARLAEVEASRAWLRATGDTR
jgi:hypothetical protein